MPPLAFWLCLAAARPTTRSDGPASIEVRSSLPPGQAVKPGDALELTFNRPLSDGQERLAVLIGGTDWTGLFVLSGQALSYRPGPLPLPVGDQLVTVYLVTAPNEWQQVAAIPVRIAAPSVLTKADVHPRVDLVNAGQVYESHRPDSNAPPRPTFQDVSAAVGLSTEHSGSGFTARTQSNFIDVTNRTAAPRFLIDGNKTPRFDLTDYLWSVDMGASHVAAGQGVFTAERHLLANFASRGLTTTLRHGGTDVTVDALSGNNVVGLDNFFGVSTTANRMAAVVVGQEIVAPHPGTARLEASFIDGSRLPLAGVTQGNVNDAQKSHGEGLRFVGSGAAGRLRLDSGFARSTFTNPQDPLLAQGLTLVPVRQTANDASYLDSSYDVIKNAHVATTPVTVTTTYKFERVDPLFASVGTAQGTRSDLLQHIVDVTGRIGATVAQVSQTFSHDNLGRVASILRTDTSITAAAITVPIGGFGGGAQAGRLPTVGYTVNRSVQIGEGLPPNGGFVSASQIPNQVNTVQTGRVDWSLPQIRLGYTLNHSFQENRQPGRELADFTNDVQTITAGFTPAAALDLSATIGLERAINHELSQRTTTARVGTIVNWRASARGAVSIIANTTLTKTAPAGRTRASDANVQYAYTLPFGKHGVMSPRLQLVARAAWQSAFSLDPIFLTRTDLSSWTFNTGVTVNVF